MPAASPPHRAGSIQCCNQSTHFFTLIRCKRGKVAMSQHLDSACSADDVVALLPLAVLVVAGYGNRDVPKHWRGTLSQAQRAVLAAEVRVERAVVPVEVLVSPAERDPTGPVDVAASGYVDLVERCKECMKSCRVCGDAGIAQRTGKSDQDIGGVVHGGHPLAATSSVSTPCARTAS